VTRADYLSGRTALHFAAIIEDVKCIRLLVADFLPGVSFDSIIVHDVNALDLKIRYDQRHVTFPHHYIGLLNRFINKAADGVITALHMAALNGYFDCVRLLLNLRVNVSTAILQCFGVL
ncbi:hypothetical protein Dimus_010993, partial [Dionaea muscipula]